MKSLMSNTVVKEEYHAFVKKTFDKIKTRRVDDRNAMPVGFLDQKILKADLDRAENLGHGLLY